MSVFELDGKSVGAAALDSQLAEEGRFEES